MIKSILIADDEPEQVALLQSLLKDRGYEVTLCSNGNEAVESAMLHHPDLIILDILMPLMDGTDAASILRQDERTKNIPIFFMTAMITVDDQSSAKGKPYKMFAKPIKFFELLEAVANLG